jgi:hypothetical protein
LGDIINLESHIEKLEKLINKNLKILEKFPNIFNKFNYGICRKEIIEEVVQKYIEEK